MSDFETFKSAIFGQESGNGAVDTSKPNYAGALGKGQILRPTFDGLKKQGKIPADYEWANPAHNEEAAVKYMEEAWSAGAGRPDLAAAYYYGGPKAVKGGQIVSYRDTKNPKAPDTVGYAKSVMQRMGLEVSTPTPRQVDNAIERKPDAADYSRLVEASIQSSVIRPPDRDAFARSLSNDQWARDLTEEARPTGWEQFSAAVHSNTDNRILRALEKRVWGEEFEAVPNFQADLTKLPKGADSRLVEDYATATSPQAAEKVLAQYSEEQARVKTVFDSGVGAGVALSLGAEFLSFSNIIPGVAAARAFQLAGKGSLALAQAGRPGAALGSAVAENAVSGTAIEAALQGMEGRFNPQDLAISLAADTLIGIGSGALTLRGAANAAAAQATERATANIVERELAHAARAEAELGPNADPEAIRARMDSYQGADLRRVAEDAIVPTRQGNLLDVSRTPGLKLDAEPAPARAAEGGLESYPTVRIADAANTESKITAPDTPEFKTFFGASKVVKPNGEARVVYHLTNADVDTFRKDLLGTNTGAASAKEGFFFAGKPATVNAYARPDEGAPNVVPVFLSMQNPKVFDMGGTVERKRTYASLLREAKAQGHDGLIIKNTVDGGPVDDIFVAFAPTQAKSAIGNRGTYSPDDPRINYDAAPRAVGAVPFRPNGNYADPATLAYRREEFVPGGRFEEHIGPKTNGKYTTLKELESLKPGLHNVSSVKNPDVTTALKTIDGLIKQFIPNYRVIINFTPSLTDGAGTTVRGSATQITDSISVINVDSTMAPSQLIRTAVHEVGHVVFNHNLSKMPTAMRRKLADAWQKFAELSRKNEIDGNAARDVRYSLLAPERAASREFTPPLSGKYQHSWDELSAEQFVKYVEDDVRAGNTLGLPAKAAQILQDAIDRALAFLKKFFREDVPTDEAYKEFFDWLRVNTAATPAPTGRGTAGLDQLSVRATPTEVANELLGDPDALRYGVSLAPMGTPKERADAQAILALHKRAEEWAAANPVDLNAIDKLMSANAFSGKLGSAGLLMLKSQSPVVRMIASELLEDASGVAGKRKATASISKYMTERLMLGSALPEVESAFNFWKKANGGSLKDDLIGGTKWTEFNKLVASEIEARRFNQPTNANPSVKGAADVLEAAYTRIANEQRKVNTTGAGALPTSSRGYMPHRMNAGQVLQLSPAKRQVLHDALVDQFITIEGWDSTFADKLAASYIDRVRSRGAGDYGSAIGGRGAASEVEEALRGMDLPEDVIANHMKSYTKGAEGWTKSRIELDLNRVYSTPEGEFRLMDIFETDQISLLRSQAGRASGDVALTKFGVQGKEGLRLLRKSMEYGEGGKQATNGERQAFDQIGAEFLNEPFGNQQGRWAERLLTANAVVRLGGVVFNQAAEAFNAVGTLGVAAAFKHIPDFARLRREAITLAKGGQVNNSLLSSIEAGGAEFGVDNYKIVMPFDNPNHVNPAFGQDTITAADRLLRGAGHLQSKVSGWRALHAVQQRSMAEQIVLKMARYSRNGQADNALDDMGITPELRQAINANNAATFDANGNPTGFDLTKIPDANQREAIAQAVWRGTNQIIQGTFIGERGLWAHDNMLKLFTQFRTFSITAMEKQTSRQLRVHGGAKLFGLLAGAMTVAMPIYMLRTALASIGREDQDEYLEQRFSPAAMAQGLTNYIGVTGLAGDVFGLGLGVAGISTSNRAGAETDFVGNYVAPGLSLVNDTWDFAQGIFTDDRSLEQALRLVPGSRIPYAVPFFNLAKD